MIQMKKPKFKETKIFSYNRLDKAVFGIAVILAAAFIFLLIATYFFLKDSDILVFRIMNTIISHISTQIAGSSILGILYTTLVGGLFFISIPLEVVFVKFLKAGHPYLIIMIPWFLGLAASFTVDYYIGYKLSGLSKRLISPKKFYKLKGLINRYGALAVLFFNATPLPSQLLTVILGVFRYNKTRFYIFFLAGQAAKYGVISIIYYLF
jgi:membrane protein YqaA with SNARE-associated domain